MAHLTPPWAAQILLALICTGTAIALRWLVDMNWPGAGPYAFAYPAMMVATLFGRWQAGLLTMLLTLAYISRMVLPLEPGRAEIDPNFSPRLLVNVASMTFGLALAEIFRRAVRDGVNQRNRQIEHLDLLLAELDHRVRNNFASVKSLLQLQIARANDPATHEALVATMNRVDGIAEANRYLYTHAASGSASVDLEQYLAELCAALAESLFGHGNGRLEWRCQKVEASRDRAVSIGLLVNELVTNAAKHAFPDGHGGTVKVSLERKDGMLCLCVADDGCGMRKSTREGGLGRRLIDALVRQVHGVLSTESGPGGTRVRLLIDPGT